MPKGDFIYTVDVGLAREGYSRRTMRIKVSGEYRGECDNADKREAAISEAKERYMALVTAEIIDAQEEVVRS